jgi:hypothetical protein
MNDEDLRDLFAGMAMQGLIHHFDFAKFRDDPQRVARWAYDAADAMIAAKYEANVPEVGIAAVKKPRKTKEQL